MKKLVFFCLVCLFWACSIDDDEFEDFENVFVPIESVEMPPSFQLGDTYQITVFYYRPSSCYTFNDFYYFADGAERTVAIVNTVYNHPNCTDLDDELVERSFIFRALYDQVYTFKFWQGEDESGEDIYLIYEIPVLE